MPRAFPAIERSDATERLRASPAKALFFQRLKHAAGKARALAWMGVLAIVVASCASVPRQELSRYVSTFDGAQRAAIEIYAELKPVNAYLRERGLISESTGGGATHWQVSGLAAGTGIKSDTQLADAPKPGGAAVAEAADGDALVTASTAATGLQVERDFISLLGPGRVSEVERCGALSGYPHLVVRCEAFEFAARYNRMITALVDDQPVGDIRTELDAAERLIGSADDTGLVTPMVGMLLQGVVTPHVLPDATIRAIQSAISKAIEANRTDDILVELKQGLPAVRQLVNLLIKDVPFVYDLQREYYESQLSTLDRALIDQMTVSVNALINITDNTAGDRTLVGQNVSRLREALKPLEEYPDYRKKLYGRLGVFDDPYRKNDPISYKSLDPVDNLQMLLTKKAKGSSAFKAAVGRSAYNRNMPEIEASIEQFSELTTRWRKFSKALSIYETLLKDLSSALQVVETKVSQQVATDQLGYVADFVRAGDAIGLGFGLVDAFGLLPTTPVDKERLDSLSESVDRRVAEIHGLLHGDAE